MQTRGHTFIQIISGKKTVWRVSDAFVWGGFIMYRRMELHIFDRRSLIGDPICDEIILVHVCLLREAFDTACVFVNDNAQPQMFQTVQELLESGHSSRVDMVSDLAVSVELRIQVLGLMKVVSVAMQISFMGGVRNFEQLGVSSGVALVA
ncbi:hypothetical protein TNCV_4618461 [Trichonephila clavipes]|nr:hypothetical protein TNCV_4618461 [Trichonephila clavipes]